MLLLTVMLHTHQTIAGCHMTKPPRGSYASKVADDLDLQLPEMLMDNLGVIKGRSCTAGSFPLAAPAAPEALCLRGFRCHCHHVVTARFGLGARVGTWQQTAHRCAAHTHKSFDWKCRRIQAPGGCPHHRVRPQPGDPQTGDPPGRLPHPAARQVQGEPAAGAGPHREPAPHGARRRHGRDQGGVEPAPWRCVRAAGARAPDELLGFVRIRQAGMVV